MNDVFCVPVAGGKFAIINAEDAATVSGFAWFENTKGGYISAKPYPQNCHLYLHRMVMPAPAGMDVDHKNRVKFDCRRDNLRIATRSQNNGNREKISATSSRFKGVSWNKREKKWKAKIKHNRTQYSLGTYAHEEDAARAYNTAAIAHFGDFSRLNQL